MTGLFSHLMNTAAGRQVAGLFMLSQAGQQIKASVQSFQPVFSTFSHIISNGFRVLFSTLTSHMASTIDRYVGQGSLNPIFEQIFAQLGRRAAEKISGSGNTGFWQQILKEVAAQAGQAAIRVASAELETLRMAGAQAYAITTAGRLPEAGEQSPDLRERGRTFLRMINEIRSRLNEPVEGIISLANSLSQLGIAFDETGAKATVYAIAADRLNNLTPGTTANLMATAVRQYGQSWDDVGQIMELVTAQRRYWAAAADVLKDPLAKALSSHETILLLYQQVQQITRTTSYDMVGLEKVFFAFAETLRSTGTIRAENLANVVGNFLNKLSPDTSNFVQTVVHSAFISDLLRLSNPGKELLGGAQEIMLREKIPSSLLNVALQQYLVQDPSATEKYVGSLLEGIIQYREAAFGEGADANEKMVAMMAARLNTTTNEAARAIQVAERYVSQRRSGLSVEDALLALRQGGIDPRQLTVLGMDMTQTASVASGIFSQGISAVDSMALAAERLTILRGENFWPKWVDIVKNARQEIYGIPTGERISPPGDIPAGTAAHVAGRGIVPPASVSGADVAMTPPRAAIAPAPGSRLPIPLHAGAYAMHTAGGVEQVSTVIDLIAEEIAAIETGRGRKNPYAVLGKPIRDPRSRMYGQFAVGKYQIMSGNVPAWTKEALGRPLTVPEFINSPEAQEKTAKHFMAKYYKKYGTAADVASMWHAGRPYSATRAIRPRDTVTGLETAVYAARVQRGVSERLGRMTEG